MRGISLDSPDYSLDSDSDFKLAEDDSPDEDLTDIALTPQHHHLHHHHCYYHHHLIRDLDRLLPLLPPVSPIAAISPPAPAEVALASVDQETMILCARDENLRQQDMVTQDSLRIARDKITWLQLRAVVSEQQATDL
ncbi:hypothetical protein Tco_0875426 [Tanacetum coccineum]|uniref:Uncharacterized protein n=1 Tax=Tanacetum coccineum TaxID=301880 RepID=A0ABQ5BPE3_9ASTR